MIENEEQYVQRGMRLGLRASDPERQRRLIRLAEVRTEQEIPYPLVQDNLARVPTWGLYQNNRFGVCGPVSVANLYRIVSAYLGPGQLDFTDEEVFDLYRRSGNPGFDPVTGADDKGVEMTVMLSELVKNGIGFGDRNRKPVAFAAVDPGNISEMRAATALFGGLLWACNLQDAQNDQFAAHQDWDYVPSSGTWGGHATMTGAYSDDPNDRLDRMTTVTWAAPVPCTNAFLKRTVVEAYVVIWPENLGSTQFQQGIDTHMLARYFYDLTGKNLDLHRAEALGAAGDQSVEPTTGPAAPSAGFTAAERELYDSLAAMVGKANAWAKEKGLHR